MNTEQLKEAAEKYAQQFKTQVSSEGLENIASDFLAGAQHILNLPQPKMSEAWVKASNAPKTSENVFVKLNNGYKTVAHCVNGRWLKDPNISRDLYVAEWLDESALNINVADGWKEESVIDYLNTLTDEQRFNIIIKYCRFCGSKDDSCQCWNDL